MNNPIESIFDITEEHNRAASPQVQVIVAQAQLKADMAIQTLKSQLVL